MKNNGFTMIELVVVIAVLSILIAVAVPYVIGIGDDAYHGKVMDKANEIIVVEYSYNKNNGFYGNKTQLQNAYPLLDFGINGISKVYGDVLVGSKGFCVKSVYNKTREESYWQIFCYFCSDDYVTSSDFSSFTNNLFGDNPTLGSTICKVQ